MPGREGDHEERLVARLDAARAQVPHRFDGGSRVHAFGSEERGQDHARPPLTCPTVDDQGPSRPHLPRCPGPRGVERLRRRYAEVLDRMVAPREPGRLGVAGRRHEGQGQHGPDTRLREGRPRPRLGPRHAGEPPLLDPGEIVYAFELVDHPPFVPAHPGRDPENRGPACHDSLQTARPARRV